MSEATQSTSAYYFPAEWKPHTGTWVTWPHNPATWPHCFQQARIEFGGLVAAISQDEICNVMAVAELQSEIKEILAKTDANMDQVVFHDWPTNDSWVRDYGPTFLFPRDEQGQLAAADLTYNGWGEKYPPFDSDQKIGKRIAQYAQAHYIDVPMKFEGGAIETDGNGRLLTTEFCALNANRNPGFTKADAEKIFHDYFGINEVWWLPGNPIEGDDTDGHIDQIARFTESGAIVIATCDNPDLEDYEKAKENLAALEAHVAASEDKPEIVHLPMPSPIEMGGQTLPASYTNFYITNHQILVPQFEDPNDTIAMDRLSRCFPSRKMTPLASRHLADGLGSFHCLTQQQPKW